MFILCWKYFTPEFWTRVCSKSNLKYYFFKKSLWYVVDGLLNKPLWKADCNHVRQGDRTISTPKRNGGLWGQCSVSSLQCLFFCWACPVVLMVFWLHIILCPLVQCCQMTDQRSLCCSWSSRWWAVLLQRLSLQPLRETFMHTCICSELLQSCFWLSEAAAATHHHRHDITNLLNNYMDHRNGKQVFIFVVEEKCRMFNKLLCHIYDIVILCCNANV